MYYHCCSGGGGDLLDWLLVSFTFVSLRFLLSEEIKAELQQEIPCTQVFLVIPWIARLVGRRGLGWDGLESKWFSLPSTTHWHSVSSVFVLSKGWEILLSWAAGPASSDNSIVLFQYLGWKTGFIRLFWFNALNLKITIEFSWIMIWVALIMKWPTLLLLFSSLPLCYFPSRWKQEGPNLSSTDSLGDGSGWKVSKWLSCSFVSEHNQNKS